MTTTVPSRLAVPHTPSWRTALAGIWKVTYPRFLSPNSLLVLLGLLTALSLLAYTGLGDADSGLYSRWTVEFYLCVIVPATAFLTAAGAIRDDMQPATVDYVLTRPISRASFVVFRYLAHTVCLEIQFLPALVLIAVVGRIHHVPTVFSNLPLLLSGQLLAVAAFSALGFVFGVLTSRYLVLGIVYSGIIELGIGNIPTQISRLSLLHQLRTVVPPAPLSSLSSNDSAAGAVLTLLVFTAVTVAVSAGIFALQEAVGSKPRET